MAQAVIQQSPLATLAERTDTKAATAPISEHVSGLTVLTGQYLFDRFIGNDEAEVSKMNLVRAWVTQYDVATVKKALSDFVGIAKEKGEAVHKTAQNHRTVMQWAYGSLRFAKQQLDTLGVTDKTGYQMMRVLGKKACEQRGIKWDGTPAKPKMAPDERERMKVEKEALSSARIKNPQQQGESVIAWEKRVLDAVDVEVEAIMVARAQTKVQDWADQIKEMCGDHLPAVLELLLQEYNISEEETE